MNQFAANGTRPAQNDYLLDGIDNNSNDVDFLSGEADVVKPRSTLSRNSKFRLITSPGIWPRRWRDCERDVEIGTNRIHGAAWEFFRTTLWTQTAISRSRDPAQAGAASKSVCVASAAPFLKTDSSGSAITRELRSTKENCRAASGCPQRRRRAAATQITKICTVLQGIFHALTRLDAVFKTGNSSIRQRRAV